MAQSPARYCLLRANTWLPARAGKPIWTRALAGHPARFSVRSIPDGFP